ncbi:MAG: OmpA family protein [Piscirickettsiaceae bacterium]|nr:OmpA family protein [Piscirickettsiaceae bacterium]
MLNTLLILTLSLFTSFAQAEQFQAPITDTQWQVIESPLECSLSQEITGYGRAKFTKKSQGELQLIFSTKMYPSTQSNASFEIAQAPWQNSEERQKLISTPTLNNQTQFILSGHFAELALTHIQEGRFPTVRYRSQSASEDISVLLSTVHFRDSHLTFQQCIDNLHPDVYNDIRKLSVYYSVEEYELSDANKEALTRIADYVKVDDSIRRINISGHTDSHGRKRLNIPLSEARVLTIKKFFIETCELPENLITTSYHREFKPAARNKTKQGRALNRRTEIEVLR